MNESRAAAAYLVNKYGKDDSLYPKVKFLFTEKWVKLSRELLYCGSQSFVNLQINLIFSVFMDPKIKSAHSGYHDHDIGIMSIQHKSYQSSELLCCGY